MKYSYQFKIATVVLLFLSVAGKNLYAQNKNGRSHVLLETGTWVSDNGNGTFTNPFFYEEFSDLDMIRVGNDYYLTGQPCIPCRAFPFCTRQTS